MHLLVGSPQSGIVPALFYVFLDLGRGRRGEEKREGERVKKNKSTNRGLVKYVSEHSHESFLTNKNEVFE